MKHIFCAPLLALVCLSSNAEPTPRTPAPGPTNPSEPGQPSPLKPAVQKKPKANPVKPMPSKPALTKPTN